MADLRTLRLVAAGLVLAALLAAAPATAQALEGPEEPTKDIRYEWWDEEWHMRVPVLVRPQMPDAVVEGHRPVLDDVKDVPVHAEIDFTQEIREVGGSPETRWPQDVGGALDSFTFDKDSVRVVRYDRDSGEVRSHPRTGDDVPHQFVPTLLEGRTLSNDRFDPSSNAVGTVTWMAEGTLDEPRLYFVYFDIEENGDKPAPSFTPEEKGALNGLYWIRPGTDAYGYVPAESRADPDARPALQVYGLYKNTAVKVESYNRPGDTRPLESCEESEANLCVRGGDRLEGFEDPTFEIQSISTDGPSSLFIPSPQSFGYFFHVQADKPVLVAVHPQDEPNCPSQVFYPGLQGLVSNELTFAKLTDPSESTSECGANQEVRIVAPQEAADVTWQWLDTGNTQSITLNARSSAPLDIPDEGVADRPVRVTSEGGPVAVVQPGRTFQQQAVSPHGAPVGSQVLAPGFGETRVVPWDSETEVLAQDYEERTDDRARDSADGGPGSAHPAVLEKLTRQGQPWTSFKGDVWASFASDDQDVSAYHGSRGLMSVGGKQGQEFHVPVEGTRGGGDDEKARMMLFPAYDRTDVVVTDNATGKEVYSGSISRDVFVDDDDGEDIFPAGTGYHVETDKPILTYALSDTGTYAGYYPTVSRSPLYEVGDASFYGRLVRWDEPLRQETMAPGQEKRFSFQVTNLGREIFGENLPDDIRVEIETAGNGSAKAAPPSVSGVDTLDSRQVSVVVSIPDEAKTGETVQVNLTAVSQGNPNFKAESKLKITVRTLFRVEMSFQDDDCNPKSCERLVESGGSTLYGIRVNNTGTGDDVYRFDFSESRSGFQGEILKPDGTVLATADESKESLSVARGEDKLVFFNVTAPEDAVAAFPYTTQVQAVSESDSTANDGVTASTVLSVNTNFRLEVPDDVRSVTPGENTTFPVRVVNEGDDTVLDVTTSEPSLGGWNVSVEPASFLLRANGTTSPSGERGDIKTVNVTVTASQDARVGQILPLEVQARSETSQGTAGEESAEIRAVAANNFTFVASGLQPRSLEPGEAYEYEFSVRNAANGPFTATVNATGLPDGWDFEKDQPAAPAELAVGDTLDVGGDLVLPPGTPAGEYNVTFTLFGESEEGRQGVSNVTGRVQVARRANLAVESPSPVVPVPPGNETGVSLNVTNAGNVDLTAELTLSGPADWGVSFRNASQKRLPLEPGESTSVDVTLSAPADIGSGPVEWGVEADLPLRAPKSFAFEADWIRRDLSVEGVEVVTDTLESGTVSVLAVTVRNEGNLPANNVDLAVVVDGDVASNSTLETLPPNQDRVVRIDWTVPSERGTLEVVIDRLDVFVETNEDNNRKSFSPTSQGAIPALNPLVAALAAGALALARRRWDP